MATLSLVISEVECAWRQQLILGVFYDFASNLLLSIHEIAANSSPYLNLAHDFCIWG
ncbi:MAG: hypothetical protein HYS18_12855 [Burkholderiales bacterium]|nr:hypothetical protein [Burkholderiales bacterium]